MERARASSALFDVPLESARKHVAGPQGSHATSLRRSLAAVTFGVLFLILTTPLFATHTHGRLPTIDYEASWTPALAHRFPGCHATREDGRFYAELVVVNLDGTMSRISFDAAWKQTHRAPGSMWVAGSCGPGVTHPSSNR